MICLHCQNYVEVVYKITCTLNQSLIFSLKRIEIPARQMRGDRVVNQGTLAGPDIVPYKL